MAFISTSNYSTSTKNDQESGSEYGSTLASDDASIFSHSPSVLSSATSASAAGLPQHHDDLLHEQRMFADHRSMLLASIDRTRQILEDLRDFNQSKWLMYYPHLNTHQDLLLKEDESQAIETTDILPKQFSIFKLDLKLGALSPTQLVRSLEKSSVAQLLDGKFQQSIQHLDNLQQRISDTNSKVLVTGDLNAGKSTFVNGLLHRNVLPVDQQPCTTIFCEVVDAKENDKREEIHAIKDAKTYDRGNKSTFDRYELDNLNHVVAKSDQYTLVKIYVHDCRNVNESLLSNGVVDIALIDAPGLNRDSLKTTALFARQEEIDVVVFVVSAENHFTLSAQEFLSNAANEKAYIFIVVNRFDQIKEKDRCRRGILEQVSQISPETYKNASELVHFVSSAAMFDQDGNVLEDNEIPEFDILEKSLRTFVLEKRCQSKLAPAQNYIKNALSDVVLLASRNNDIANQERNRAMDELKRILPALDQLHKQRDYAFDEIGHVTEDVDDKVHSIARSKLKFALQNLESRTLIPYGSIWEPFTFAKQVKEQMLSILSQEIRECEASSRELTIRGVEAIGHLGIKHLPDYTPKMLLAENMYRKSMTADMISQLFIDIEWLDFINIDMSVNSKDLASVSMSMTAFGFVGFRYFGVQDAVSMALRASRALGSENIKKWGIPLLMLSAAGFLVYVVGDIPNAVPRNISRRIRETAEKQNWTESEVERIAKEARRMTRYAGWHLQNAFENNVEEQEVKKQENRTILEKTTEASRFFTRLIIKAEELYSNVSKHDLFTKT